MAIPFCFSLMPGMSTHMKAKLLCLLLCLSGIRLPVFALKGYLIAAPDSVHDSLTVHIPSDKFSYFLLNGSPFIYDRIFSAFQFDSLEIIRAGQYRFGLNPYKQYFDLPSHIPQLDTNLGVSDLNVVLGSTREQLLFLDHQQRISKRMIGFLSYNSIVSPGFLLNCLSKYRSFKLGGRYTTDFIQSDLLFHYAKVEADENGGVLPDQEVNGLSRSDFEQLKTFLKDDKRVVRRYVFQLKNELLLFNQALSDSGADIKIKLHADGTWLNWGTSYSGTADTSFYRTVYKDSALTFDTSGYHSLQFNPAAGFYLTRNKCLFAVKAGLGFVVLDQKIDSVKSTIKYQNPFVSATLKSNVFSLTVDVSVVKGNKVNDGDFSLMTDLIVRPKSDFFSFFRLTAGLSELAPEATSLSYSSNHFLWSNTFRKEGLRYFKSSVSFFKDRFYFFSNFYQWDSKVYFDPNAIPVQAVGLTSVVENGLKLDLVLKKWRCIALARNTMPSENFIRIPEFGGYARVSFRDRFFKKALLAEFGSSVYAVSAWKGLSFMPATGASYLQSIQTVGGVPVIDVFVNADIGRATLSFMMQNMNDRFLGGENYIAPAYPSPPRTFKFSLHWRLYN